MRSSFPGARAKEIGLQLAFTSEGSDAILRRVLSIDAKEGAPADVTWVVREDALDEILDRVEDAVLQANRADLGGAYGVTLAAPATGRCPRRTPVYA